MLSTMQHHTYRFHNNSPKFNWYSELSDYRLFFSFWENGILRDQTHYSTSPPNYSITSSDLGGGGGGDDDDDDQGTISDPYPAQKGGTGP